MAELEEIARKLFVDELHPYQAALESHGERAAVAAIVKALTLNKTILSDLLHAELGDSYDCTRVWSAWSYGTMGPDDFVPLSERVDEIASGIVDRHAQALATTTEVEA